MEERPIFPDGPVRERGGPCNRRSVISSLVVWLVAAATLAPTLKNGFLVLGFDDAIVLESPLLESLDAEHVLAMFSGPSQAHWTPLTMLSFALERTLWGKQATGYHATNVVLHATAAMLAFLFLQRLVRHRAIALLAALVFAVHPLQLEAVSVVMQRKTVLSGALFFATLLAYERWRLSRHRGWYGGAVALFAAAAMSKPSVASLPLILLLRERSFGETIHIADKIPFFAFSALCVLAAVAAHVDVGAIHPPHGGSLGAHFLMVARVTVDYLISFVLPVDLSPIYYYRQDALWSLRNFARLLVLLLAVPLAFSGRRQRPWVFFCAGWFVLTLLPQANIFPLAQLRADRFLYLPILGPGLGAALLLHHIARRRPSPLWHAVALLWVLSLATLTFASTSVWRSDVSAWTRVVEQHRWCGLAYEKLARAHEREGHPRTALRILHRGLREDPDRARTYLAVGLFHLRQGALDRAAHWLREYVAQEPDDTEAQQLLHRVEARLRPLPRLPATDM